MKLKTLKTEGIIDIMLKIFDKFYSTKNISYSKMKSDFENDYKKLKDLQKNIDNLKQTLKSNPKAMEYIKQNNLEKLLEL